MNQQPPPPVRPPVRLTGADRIVLALIIFGLLFGGCVIGTVAVTPS